MEVSSGIARVNPTGVCGGSLAARLQFAAQERVTAESDDRVLLHRRTPLEPAPTQGIDVDRVGPPIEYLFGGHQSGGRAMHESVPAEPGA